MMVAVLWIICIVSQNRLVSVEGVTYISAAVIPYPFLCILFDIIAELYGYKESRKTLWMAFVCIYLFVISVFLFAKLPSPNFWQQMSQTYDGEMSPLLRILFFNSISFVIGQYINIYFFSKLRAIFNGKFFGLRSIGSTLIGDTITFAIAILGDFSGLIKSHSLVAMIIDELVIMYLMAIILAVPVSYLVSVLKKNEPDFDMSVRFNPFKK